VKTCEKTTLSSRRQGAKTHLPEPFCLQLRPWRLLRPCVRSFSFSNNFLTSSERKGTSSLPNSIRIGRSRASVLPANRDEFGANLMPKACTQPGTSSTFLQHSKPEARHSLSRGPADLCQRNVIRAVAVVHIPQSPFRSKSGESDRLGPSPQLTGTTWVVKSNFRFSVRSTPSNAQRSGQ